MPISYKNWRHKCICGIWGTVPSGSFIIDTTHCYIIHTKQPVTSRDLQKVWTNHRSQTLIPVPIFTGRKSSTPVYFPHNITALLVIYLPRYEKIFQLYTSMPVTGIFKPALSLQPSIFNKIFSKFFFTNRWNHMELEKHQKKIKSSI